ncbi:MAG: ATP-NAD kinase family protein [Promethearchaeia archaeon]
MNSQDFQIGLIINPISGMGGSVGLKGTDGREILDKAIKMGAQPNAADRTKQLLHGLETIKSKLMFITCLDGMGEDVLKEMGFKYTLINSVSVPNIEDIEVEVANSTYKTVSAFKEIKNIYDSRAYHTKLAAKVMKEMDDLKLIIFVGGDGTARDIYEEVDQDVPCLGVPAGVKIYSSVFSLNPAKAASLIMRFLWDEAALKKAEVLDIDEVEFRKGNLVSKLYGYLLTPFDPGYRQPSKLGTPSSDLDNQERIARRIIDLLEKDTYYLIGPGTTTKAITDRLDEDKSVLGVDLLYNKDVIARDLNEYEILKYVNQEKPTKIVVSPIGRQGFLFGRGNLQYSPEVLRKVGPKNIIIISTQFKLQKIPGQTLRLDTRDPQLDKEFEGLYKIITDYDQIQICRVEK